MKSWGQTPAGRGVHGKQRTGYSKSHRFFDKRNTVRQLRPGYCILDIEEPAVVSNGTFIGHQSALWHRLGRDARSQLPGCRHAECGYLGSSRLGIFTDMYAERRV